MANMYDIVNIGGLLLQQWSAAIHIRDQASDRYLEGLILVLIKNLEKIFIAPKVR